MRLFSPVLAGLVAACVTIAPAAAQGSDARVIVKFKAGSPLLRSTILSVDQRQRSQAEAVGARIGHALRAGASVSERTQLVMASGIASEALAARIAQEPDVEYAVVDRRRYRSAVPNDPRYGNNLGGGVTPAAGQWYLRPNDATFVSAINAEQAWDTTTGSASVVVAVLDSGIRADHPDLAGNLVGGYDLISDLPTAGDGNGWDANPADEGDYLTQTEINSNPASFQGCQTQATSSWHGTQVAGIVGAVTDNNVGMASVGRNVKVLSVRVLGKCGGYDVDILAGMKWAAGLSVPGLPINPTPANVLNMSLGGATTCSQVYIDTVAEIHAARPGTVIVASAGNEGLPVASPANCPGVVAVGGVRHTGTKVGYSDLGPEVAITAPAGNCVLPGQTDPCLYPILTTTNTGTTTPVTNGAGGSAYTDSFNPTLGTSFSAPLVAGTAALMLSRNPGLTQSQTTLALQIGSRPFPTSGAGPGVTTCPAQASVSVDECYCTTTTCGAGLLDAAGAVGVANTTRAFFAFGPANPVATQNITLDAALSFAAPGRNLVGYSWSLVPGIASFSSAANQPTATVVASSSGTFDVTLTVFDSQGGSSSETQRISVQAAPAGAGGGGGGGALGAPWLVALAAAAFALRRRSR